MAEVPLVISVDDHVMEPPDLWQRWLPAKYRDQGPKVVRAPYRRKPGVRDISTYLYEIAPDGPETDFWIYEDMERAIQASFVNPAADCDEIGITPLTYDEMRPGTWQLKARLEDMTLAGIERSVIFPNIARFCGQTFLDAKDKEVALECVYAYNNFLVEEWTADGGGRIIPMGLVPLWDVELAAAEVRRNAARGVTAVAFSEIPAKLGLASVHTRYWDPFLQACDETGTVICCHLGGSSTSFTTSEDAPPGLNMSIFSVNSMISFADLLTSGILARFPNLKYAYSESQIGWIPYFLEQLDRVWQKPYSLTKLDPVLKEAPSSYYKDRVYGCFFDDAYGIENRYRIGIDQITFESDYPHQDTNWPNTRSLAQELLGDLPQEDANKIARENAIRLFRLPETLPA